MVFKLYKFKVTEPKNKPMKSFMAMAKIARKEDTGFFLDYETMYPTFNNVTISKIENDYILSVKSNCLVGKLFITELSNFLKTDKVEQIKSKD